MLKIGVDIGGTFTDFAVWRDGTDDYRQIDGEKLPTSRPDFARAVIEGLTRIAERQGVRPDDPVLVVHGTTVGTNAIIERSEPPVALITTQGYRDILNIARLRLDKPVDLFNRRPTPLVPRALVFEVTERLRADGSTDTALDEASVVAAITAARAAGAAAIGVCLMHAYRNPVHETRVLEIARSRFPDLDIMASHEIWPQQSEYERSILTLLNIYVKRLMAGYIAAIDRFLRDRLPNARLLVTKSNGGVMSAAEACRLPVHTLLSGPAAGVTAAQALGEWSQAGSILTMDMGGTSTDVSLVAGGTSHRHSTGRGRRLSLVPARHRDRGDGGRRRLDRLAGRQGAEGRSAQRRLQAGPRLLWHRRQRANADRRLPAVQLPVAARIARWPPAALARHGRGRDGADRGSGRRRRGGGGGKLHRRRHLQHAGQGAAVPRPRRHWRGRPDADDLRRRRRHPWAAAGRGGGDQAHPGPAPVIGVLRLRGPGRRPGA